MKPRGSRLAGSRKSRANSAAPPSPPPPRPPRLAARFAVARRTGRPRDLKASLRQANETGHEDDAQRMQTIIELVLALSVHDKASRGHSERVRVFTDLLATELKALELQSWAQVPCQ